MADVPRGTFLAVILILLVGGLSACASSTSNIPEDSSMTRARETGTQVGQRHPDFVFPRIDGSGFERLSDYRGKKLVLIHFASW